MTKLCIPLLIRAMASAHALAQDAASEESWGWGGEDILATPLSMPAANSPRVPLFDEVIGKRLLDKDFKFIANADSVREYATKSTTAYNNAYRRWGAEQNELYNNVFAYLDSDAWEEDLEKLPAGDAAFVRIVVYDVFFHKVDKRYVQIQLSKIENEGQRNYLEQKYHVKSETEELHKNRWMMSVGFGANFFSNGADDVLKNTPAIDMGAGYCLFGRYCADFHIGGIFQRGLKEDVVQEGFTYSKNDVSYTAVEALFRVNALTSYDYELSVYGGLRLHALENDTKQDDKYLEKYGRKMDDFYSFGYTTGIIGAWYFGGDGSTPKIFGISTRIGVATFGDTELHITGYNWYATLNFLLRGGVSNK